MIVSRFTFFNENFVICCYQVTKIFCTRYGSANASSARSPYNFGPLTDLAIWDFREVNVNNVFTQNHTSRRRRLQRWFMSVSLCFQELYHPRDFLGILAAISVFQNTTGRPVLFVQHVNLTQVLDGNLSHSDLPLFESHCRSTQLWLVKKTRLRKM